MKPSVNISACSRARRARSAAYSLLAFGLGWALAPSAGADTLAYDGFAAGDSNLEGEYTAEPGGGVGRHYLAPGQNPLLGGFDGSWTNSGSQYELGSSPISSLTYAGVTSTGNAAFRSFTVGKSSRPLAAGLVGADGTTAYFSFLMKLDDTTNLGRLEFSESSVTANGGGLRVRSTGGDFVASAGFNSLTLAAADTNTHLFVWRVDFGATDSYALYMDPTDLAVESSNTAAFSGSGTDIDPAFLTLERDSSGGTIPNGVIFDEIRIATDWGSDLFNSTENFTQVGFSAGVINDVTGLSFSSTSGKVYRLQYSTDLVNTNTWTDTGLSLVGDGTEQALFDPAGFSTQKAYRVVLP